jgi:epoxyqueuosine reductase
METAALRDMIIRKTLEFGADDAGICLAADLLRGPTHSRFPLPAGIEDGHSIIVFGLNHPPDKPELDHFVKRDGARFGNSEGNRRLMGISEQIGQWLGEEGFVSRDLHYYVERGGVYLKGAAVLSGLGTIGLNNLLIHPGYGARVRFRAHLVERALTPSTPLDFDPCSGCSRPCLNVCPEGALDQNGYFTDRCQVRLNRDMEEGEVLPGKGDDPPAREAHCCRLCELSCTHTGTLE